MLRGGRLAIIITAMHEGRFYALGVACNVYRNSYSDMLDIAKKLNLKSNGDFLWSLEGVRSAKGNNRARFNRHWREAHRWVQWRCPQTHFAWFSAPVQLNPIKISGKDALVKEHNGYQRIAPYQAIEIVGQRLPADHSVLGWLSAGTFDEPRSSLVKPSRSRKSASTSSDPYIRYLQESEIVISPLHHTLQSAFEAYLVSSGVVDIKSNADRVDVRYSASQFGPILVEIKPTEQSTVRFAIRAAIGQLLDYRQCVGSNPRLLIVIGSEPSSKDDVELALQNGFGLAWRTPTGFEIRWPETFDRLSRKSAKLTTTRLSGAAPYAEKTPLRIDSTRRPEAN